MSSCIVTTHFVFLRQIVEALSQKTHEVRLRVPESGAEDTLAVHGIAVGGRLCSSLWQLRKFVIKALPNKFRSV